MQISTKDSRNTSGRADWTLDCMDDKDRLQEMLVVIEAKERGILAKQLFHSSRHIVQDARVTQQNCSIWNGHWL
jgi:hypothetical protein